MSFAFDCSVFEGATEDDCQYLEIINESLIGNLLHVDTFTPKHELVQNYNDDINPVKPTDVSKTNQGVIMNAWVSTLHVEPSVFYQNKLYGDTIFTVHSEYDYDVQVPSTKYYNRRRSGRDCKIKYYLDRNSATLKHKLNR